MSYSLVQLWNGSNKAEVDNSGALKVTSTSAGSSNFVSLTPFTGAPTHTSAIVSTTRASVLAANANRRFLTLINDSVNTIYVGFGITVGASTGIRLNGYGGGIILDSSGYIPLTAIDAVATGVSSNLLITEA